MNDLSPLVTHALTTLSVYKYPLLYVAMIFEGPIITVAGGFLLHLGLVSPVPIFLTLCAGDLTGDVGWYYIGKYFLEPALRKRGHFLSITPETVAKVKRLFLKYQTRILFISKITMGFGMALGTLMVAGASRVPFKKYMTMNALGELALVAMLMAVGYFFGNLYDSLALGLRELTIAGGLILAVAALFGFSLYVRRNIIAKI